MELFRGPGFLGTYASFSADLSLVLILVTAALFTYGRHLALQKRFSAHGWVQTITVILNLLVVELAGMSNVFSEQIVPALPENLNVGYYAVITSHAALGIVSILLGLFIVLRGNNLVPRSFRFSNYKPYMRTSYFLYMFTAFTGVAVYVLVYVVGI